jgi:PIN domain nuclease of toxin-antitoxin system
MNLLLDSHVFLWCSRETDRLSSAAYAAIRDPGNEVHVSIVTPWELAIKQALGRLVLPVPFEAMLEAMEFSLLPVNLGHTRLLAELPAHHRDPFDRMLIAQAQGEGLTLVTRDGKMRRYDVATLW